MSTCPHTLGLPAGLLQAAPDVHSRPPTATDATGNWPRLTRTPAPTGRWPGSMTAMTPTCHAWAAQRPGPTLLVATDQLAG